MRIDGRPDNQEAAINFVNSAKAESLCRGEVILPKCRTVCFGVSCRLTRQPSRIFSPMMRKASNRSVMR